MFGLRKLAYAVNDLCGVLSELLEQQQTEFVWFKSHHNLATKEDLENTEKKIMSAISDFAAKQKAFNERQDAAVTALQGDVTSLNDTITKLQGTVGTITTEDQALLDALEERGEAIAAKLEALDAQTPPTPPTA